MGNACLYRKGLNDVLDLLKNERMPHAQTIAPTTGHMGIRLDNARIQGQTFHFNRTFSGNCDHRNPRFDPVARVEQSAGERQADQVHFQPEANRYGVFPVRQ